MELMELKVTNTPEGEKKFTLRRDTRGWGRFEEVPLSDLPKEIWLKELTNTYSNEPLCSNGCEAYVFAQVPIKSVGYFAKGIICGQCTRVLLRVRKKNQKDEVRYFTTEPEMVAF